MSFMFYYANAFNGAIGSWDVGAVTTMRNMVYYANAFNGDMASWDVEKVTTMGYMFGQAAAFNEDIASWDVGEVKDMREMFRQAAAFNGAIASWNVGKVTAMTMMFNDASAFNADSKKELVDGWKTNIEFVSSVCSGWGLCESAQCSTITCADGWTADSSAAATKCAAQFPGVCDNSGADNALCCNVNTCSTAPVAPASGTVGFSATNDHASIATFACNSGYTQSGDETVACDATTDEAPWQTATTAATCAVNSCSAAPLAPADGTVAFSATNDHDSVATFACDTGFTRSGDETVACDATADEAAWQTATTAATCADDPCPATSTASGTTPEAVESATGTGITVTCATGYSTTDTATCNADNTWDLPTCEAISCGITGYAGVDGSCICDFGYAGTVIYLDGAPTGCSACSDENQYTDEQGDEECSSCPHGHASNAANNACDGDECQHPTSLPANSKVDPADASACPGSGTIQSASDGTSASQCRLICSSGYVASNVQPYLCKADSATTAAYDMAQDGSITCTAATCASIEVAYSDKSSGTGTSTTTGTVAVACDDGSSGSADAVCTADNGAETAKFAAFTPCAAATCASIEVAYSEKSSGTGTSTTT